MNKVSIVMATYKPNLEYFKKQLSSLNKQEYSNLELIICDDSADEILFREIETIVKANVTAFKVNIVKNKQNLGSNKTFERLTSLATGEYIAYCDQDDIWESYKIKKLVEELERTHSIVCYSDLAVINEEDEVISNSFKKFSKRLNHIHGERVYHYFLRRNSITGCTMLVNTEIAKKSIPFPSYDEYVHDHWLALYSSCYGRVAYVEEPLIKYRIHSNNQIGAKVLFNIDRKHEYLTNKLYVERKKVETLKRHSLSNENKDIEYGIKCFETFVRERIEFFEDLSFKTLFKFLRHLPFDPILITFEFLVRLLPNFLSHKLIQKAKS